MPLDNTIAENLKTHACGPFDGGQTLTESAGQTRILLGSGTDRNTQSCLRQVAYPHGDSLAAVRELNIYC